MCSLRGLQSENPKRKPLFEAKVLEERCTDRDTSYDSPMKFEVGPFGPFGPFGVSMMLHVENTKVGEALLKGSTTRQRLLL